MTYEVLFTIAYVLGLLFAFCGGFVFATIQALKARQKMFDCGVDFLREVWK